MADQGSKVQWQGGEAWPCAPPHPPQDPSSHHVSLRPAGNMIDHASIIDKHSFPETSALSTWCEHLQAPLHCCLSRRPVAIEGNAHVMFLLASRGMSATCSNAFGCTRRA